MFFLLKYDVTSNLIHMCRCLKYNNKLIVGKREVPRRSSVRNSIQRFGAGKLPRDPVFPSLPALQGGKSLKQCTNRSNFLRLFGKSKTVYMFVSLHKRSEAGTRVSTAYPDSF